MSCGAPTVRLQDWPGCSPCESKLPSSATTRCVATPWLRNTTVPDGGTSTLAGENAKSTTATVTTFVGCDARAADTNPHTADPTKRTSATSWPTRADPRCSTTSSDARDVTPPAAP